MAVLPIGWRIVDEWLGYWVFCRGVVGFVFKFGSNWSTFDVSNFNFSERGWCRVHARNMSELSGPTSLSLTLVVGLHGPTQQDFPLNSNSKAGG